MAKSKFKYNLNHYIGLLPRTVKMGDIEKILAEEHGISRDIFYRDRNVSIKSTFSIPSERLDIYAALLSVSADSLKNYSVKVKPLSERNNSNLDKIKAITGLKTK